MSDKLNNNSKPYKIVFNLPIKLFKKAEKADLLEQIKYYLNPSLDELGFIPVVYGKIGYNSIINIVDLTDELKR